jgi:hypothetical protein
VHVALPHHGRAAAGMRLAPSAESRAIEPQCAHSAIIIRPQTHQSCVDAADSDSGSLGGEETQVELEFDDPCEDDFHIVKALCQPYLGGADLDSSALSDAIVDQVHALIS